MGGAENRENRYIPLRAHLSDQSIVSFPAAVAAQQ
jgi:hypothetical protein